jgi:hypothetical protein
MVDIAESIPVRHFATSLYRKIGFAAPLPRAASALLRMASAFSAKD